MAIRHAQQAAPMGATWATPYRFTVAEYERMATAGILDEDSRVELIDGVVVEMNPISSRHAACVKRLNILLGRLLGDTVIVAVQNPIQLGAHSAPQPDLAALRPRADMYAAAHPTADDVLVLIEVADSSAAADRHVKLPSMPKARSARSG